MSGSELRILALACDYDGTLAHDGVMDRDTIAALDRFLGSGRRLLMVTGRELEELKSVCSVLDRFEWVVAENGALLYRPADGAVTLLCDPPSQELARRLRDAGAKPLSVGHTIIATREPYEVAALALIKELGLELHVIFNKGAVMILPSGVNKATGLKRILKQLQFEATRVVGVGDAENDHAFLELCGVGASVANALPTLKERADLVLNGARGAGVVELIDRILENDLADVTARPRPAIVQDRPLS